MDLTAKEKANELFDKMQNVVIDVYSDQYNKAKECAKVAVNEIIKSLTTIEEDKYELVAYWIEVLTELDNLKK